jgi:anti-sigma factor RsiW
MAMTCREVLASTQALVDGTLEATEVQALEAHLAACSSCREEVEALRLLHRALAGEGLVAPPPELALRIARQLALRFRSTPAWAEALTLSSGAIAAAGLTFVGLRAVAHAAHLAVPGPLLISLVIVAASLGVAGASARMYQA